MSDLPEPGRKSGKCYIFATTGYDMSYVISLEKYIVDKETPSN